MSKEQKSAVIDKPVKTIKPAAKVTKTPAPAKATKPAAKETPVKESVFVQAARDINKVLAPSPLLDVTATDAALKKELSELVSEINPGDGLNADTFKLLKELGFSKKAVKKVEKPTTKAKDGTVKVKGERKPGVGARIKELLLAKGGWEKGNQDLADEAKKAFPESKTNAACVAWYRMDLKRKGLVK